MGELNIIIGPMFAGKSTYLINKAKEIIESGVSKDNILMINHIFDKRYNDEANICTHDGKQMASISLQNLNDLFTIHNKFVNFDDILYIFIDEGQFFTDLYKVVKTLLLNYNKVIYIGGLDGDYKQDQFTESHLLDLIPYATSVKKLNARCSYCNQPAPFTKRLTVSNEQILVGGAAEYKPVCLNHLR